MGGEGRRGEGVGIVVSSGFFFFLKGKVEVSYQE